MSAALGPSRSLITAIVLLVGIPMVVFLFFSPDQMTSQVTVDSFSTTQGEPRLVVMAGGSEITLSENSELSQRISDDQQRLRLVKGSATFLVIENSAQPFWVQVGSFRLRAYTSAFRMTLKESQLTLQVMDGSVRGHWAGAAQTFTAGERLEISL